ncbi:MAG: hypothetical protein ACP5KY_06285, partial [Thermoproteus sp.]
MPPFCSPGVPGGTGRGIVPGDFPRRGPPGGLTPPLLLCGSRALSPPLPLRGGAGIYRPMCL